MSLRCVNNMMERLDLFLLLLPEKVDEELIFFSKKFLVSKEEETLLKVLNLKYDNC